MTLSWQPMTISLFFHKVEMFSVLTETIALRAKVYEMRQQAMVVWQEVHEGMKKEFNDVIHDMFSAHSQLQNNFDEFRLVLVFHT